MAFPFLSEEGFEAGTIGHFDTKGDDENRLDVAHYSALAVVPGLSAPYRGAYCLRVNLASDGSPANAYLQETVSWDTAAGGTIFFRFMFYVSPNTVLITNTEFRIFELWSGTNTTEGTASITYTTSTGFRIGIGEGSATQFLGLSLGVWHCLELKFVIDSGAPNDGTIDAWLDGSPFTQVTGLDQGAITSGVIGVLEQENVTGEKGYILFDDIIADDLRIYPPSFRFPTDVLLTKSGHVFVGNGEISNVSLLSGAAADNVLSVYDTDTANTLDATRLLLELKNVTASDIVDPAGTPICVKHGAYVALSGTNPRAMVKICRATGYSSDGAIREVGASRKPHFIDS